MPTFSAMLSFAAVAFVLIVIPGPSVMFVVGRALALGRRAAIASVVGNAIGVFAQAALVAFGLGAIVTRSQAVFQLLRIAGAAYLVFLGVQAIRDRHALSAGPVQATRQSAIDRVRQGVIVGVTNPKGFALFSAVLPQFVDPSGAPAPAQMLVFGTLAVAIALVSDSTWAMVAGTARHWIAGTPRRAEAFGVAGGVMMIGLGLQLAITGRKR